MYLVDTNVVSELRKVRLGRGSRNVELWSDSVEINDLYVSVITVFELEAGIQLKERRDLKQGRLLRRWLEHHVLVAFENRILPVTMEIARKCAALHVPDPRPFRDSFVAATALTHKMIVVTRDEQDFLPLGVQVINPFRFQ